MLNRGLSLIAGFSVGCAPADSADARTAKAPSTQPEPNRIECRISRVADGDSFSCGNAGRVRLLMIDAPELAQGGAARQALNAFTTIAPIGTPVSIETDVRPRDDYQRILGYAFLPDGRMINEEMARSGFAVALVYPPNVKYAARIRSAVADARKARRGLWATDFFECPPRDYRSGRCGGGKPRDARPR